MRKIIVNALLAFGGENKSPSSKYVDLSSSYACVVHAVDERTFTHVYLALRKDKGSQGCKNDALGRTVKSIRERFRNERNTTKAQLNT